jgi:CelD/BcsL family acetyltransferase involved in cellulose biosynthesis
MNRRDKSFYSRPDHLLTVPKVQTRTVKGIEEIAHMRDDWDAVVKASHGTIFQSHAFTMAWLKRFSDRAAIEVSVVQKDGKIQGILPAASHVVKILRMNARVFSPVGVCGAENVFHNLGPMLAAEDDESLHLMVKEISKQRWDLMDFRFLADTPTNHRFMDAISSNWTVAESTPTSCPFIELPADGDVMAVIGSRTRRSIRSSIKNLEREERLSFRTLHDRSSMLAACRDHVELHQHRWKRKGGSIFADKVQIEFLQDLVKIAADGGYGAFYTVEVDGTVAAQLLCFYDGEWCRAYQLSVNERYLDENPGHLVVHQMMQDVQSKGMRLIDFGPGSDLYKFRLGAKEAYTIGFQAMRGKLALMKKASTLPGVRTIVKRTGMRDKALESMNVPPKELR